MGARSSSSKKKAKSKKGGGRVGGGDNNANSSNNSNDTEVLTLDLGNDGQPTTFTTGGAPIPPCAARLFCPTAQFTDIEESCADVRFFALKPKTHAQLKACGVPMKLAEILLLSDIMVPADKDNDNDGGGSRAKVHKGAAYAHIAAAEALRNLISADDGISSNNTNDASSSSVMATLTASDRSVVAAIEGGESVASNAAVGAHVQPSSLDSMAFSVRLASKLHQVWQLVLAAKAEAGSSPQWFADVSTTDDVNISNRSAAAATGSVYLVLLRLLEELLSLTSVCVEGGETTAVVLARPQHNGISFFSGMLLSCLQTAVTVAFQNVSHGAGYFKQEEDDQQQQQPSSDANNASSNNSSNFMSALRYFKREETKVLARVAVAAGDLLRTLTESSKGLARLLLSLPANSNTNATAADQVAFLNVTADATALCAWLESFFLNNSSCISGNGATTTTVHGGFDVRNAGSFDEKTVLFQLVQACTHIQGALINASATVANNTSGNKSSSRAAAVDAAGASLVRVMPLLTRVLAYVAPTRVWSAVLPLLLQSDGMLQTAFEANNHNCNHNNDPLLTFLFSLCQQQLSCGGENAAAPSPTPLSLLSPDVIDAAVAMSTAELRCVQAAAKVFASAVDFICDQNNGSSNDDDDDDETAFRANRLASILLTPTTTVASTSSACDGPQRVNALYAFGSLLKNLLWMDRGIDSTLTTNGSVAAVASSASVGGGDVMGNNNGNALMSAVVGLLRQQRGLLTRFTDDNAHVTTLQFALLSGEVAVWHTASMLLMMLPVESLGAPQLIWRAIADHAEQRHRILVSVVSSQQNSNNCDGMGDNEEDNNSSGGGVTVNSSVVPLLWLQLEPLTSLLWTLQRKNSRTLLSLSSSTTTTTTSDKAAAIASGRLVVPLPTDVDLLIRVFWESQADAALKQSCVAAVGLMCAAVGTAEAAAAGARFAAAVVRNGTSPELTHLEAVYSCGGCDNTAGTTATAATLLQLGGGLVANSTGPPPSSSSDGQSQRWFELLSAVDSVVSLRCEAANAAMDLFLDERFDSAVYTPLGLQAVLSAFQAQLRQFIKKRTQLARDTARAVSKSGGSDGGHSGLLLDGSVDEAVAAQWAEVEENLRGFVAYKAANAHRA